MASTKIVIAGRHFEIGVYRLKNSTEYRCHFHEKTVWLGREWGYNTTNKNGTTEEREDIYDWFKEMVEATIPQDADGDEVLGTVVEKLTDEFEEVERQG